jgi:hypothetical protein
MFDGTGLRTTCFVSALALSAGVVSAGEPSVGPQQRVDVAGGTFASNETTAAVSNVNPQGIVAAWNDWRDSPTVTDEAIRAGVAISLNGGVTWTDFVVRPPVPNQSGVEGDPMTAQDPRTGALWVGAISFAGNGGLYVARKNPVDDFFQPSVMADNGSGIDKCWMVAGRDPISPVSTRLYIAYNFGLVFSDDMGESWNNPMSLGNGLGFLPRIGPDGELYVAYWDFFNNSFNIKRSFDGSSPFTTHIVAQRMDNWSTETQNTRFPGTFRVPPLPGLAVDPDHGTLYAVYPDTTDQVGGQANVDVYFTRSFDQGDTWLPPVVLNGEGPFTGDQFFPWIEVDPTGRLHVVFLDTRNTDQLDNVVDGRVDAYYAYSEDQGQSWTEIRLTPQSWNSNLDGLNRPAQFIGDYLGMGVTEETAWPFYPDTQNGDTDIYTNEISFATCATPGEVQDLTVSISEDGSDLTFGWNSSDPVLSFIVFEDTAADGTFDDVAATASGFLPQIVLPTPAGSRFYLVAGRNGCGIGPK